MSKHWLPLDVYVEREPVLGTYLCHCFLVASFLYLFLKNCQSAAMILKYYCRHRHILDINLENNNLLDQFQT